MSILSGLAIYFIIWWVVLFAVLPFGVKNAHEAHTNVDEGHDAGAPVLAMMWRKALVTTVIAALVYAFVLWLINSGAVTLDSLPFIRQAPVIQ